MIEGVVNASRQATITLLIQGPTGRTREVVAVIDTGYNEHLTLPPTLVRELELRTDAADTATLADASEVTLDRYGVTVMWDEQPMHIAAHELNTTPLVGMALLEWHNLNIDVERGGRVAIQANS